MRKGFLLGLLLCMAVGGIAEAGQFRITMPKELRKRQPPPGRRESRLDIINDDDWGYAIDVDYRRNRLEFQHRSSGDVYVPGNSRISLVFDDDDDWRIYGDNDWLNIEIRAGRTTTLRLETKRNRNQVGLFGTVNDGRQHYSKQLFRYSDRPGRNPAPPPASHTARPSSPPRPAPAPAPAPRPQPGRPEPSKGAAVGAAVGGFIDALLDDDKPGRRR